MLRFFEMGGNIAVEIAAFISVSHDKRFWRVTPVVERLFPVSAIVDAVAWRNHADNMIRIVPPFFRDA